MLDKILDISTKEDDADLQSLVNELEKNPEKFTSYLILRCRKQQAEQSSKNFVILRMTIDKNAKQELIDRIGKNDPNLLIANFSAHRPCYVLCESDVERLIAALEKNNCLEELNLSFVDVVSKFLPKLGEVLSKHPKIKKFSCMLENSPRDQFTVFTKNLKGKQLEVIAKFPSENIISLWNEETCLFDPLPEHALSKLIQNCKHIEELKSLCKKIYRLQGNQQNYSGEELLQIINEAEKDPAHLMRVTSACGLRYKVKALCMQLPVYAQTTFFSSDPLALSISEKIAAAKDMEELIRLLLTHEGKIGGRSVKEWSTILRAFASSSGEKLEFNTITRDKGLRDKVKTFYQTKDERYHPYTKLQDNK